MQFLRVDYVFPFKVRQEIPEVFDDFLGLRRVLDVLVLLVDVLSGCNFQSLGRYLLTLDVLSDMVHYDLFVVDFRLVLVYLGMRLRLSRRWLALNQKLLRVTGCILQR